MENLKELEELESLFELSNLDEFDTGLPMLIWVSIKYPNHLPRIKVQRTYTNKVIIGDTFSVTISDNPEIIAGDQGKISNKDLTDVFTWISLNKEVLLDYWDSKIVTRELISNLKKVSGKNNNETF